MRFKHLALVLAGLALVACETPGGDSSSTSGDGRAAPSTPPPPITSQSVPSDVRPGSSEDFAVNVGDRVFFGFDRFELSAEARDTLEKQAAWLKRYSGAPITIAGHTDERGTREYNLALGEKRAAAVKNYLVALGIEPDRVRTISYGKERPVDPRSSEAAWSKNRRGVTMIAGAKVGLSN